MYCYLGFRVIHLASFQHKTTFWKDKKNATAIGLIAVSISIVIQIFLNITFYNNTIHDIGIKKRFNFDCLCCWELC